jgi:hypothetical protein
MEPSGENDVEDQMAIQDFDRVGVCLITGVLAAQSLTPLREAVDECITSGPDDRMFRLPEFDGGGLGLHALLSDLACRLAGRPARLVRILAFDKTLAANWGVPWHQDRTIAVKQRVAIDSFGPWSVKAGVPHVEPPPALLEAIWSICGMPVPACPEPAQRR